MFTAEDIFMNFHIFLHVHILWNIIQKLVFFYYIELQITEEQKEMLKHFEVQESHICEDRPGVVVFQPQHYKSLFSSMLHPTHCGFTVGSNGLMLEKHIESLRIGECIKHIEYLGPDECIKHIEYLRLGEWKAQRISQAIEWKAQRIFEARWVTST